MHGYTPAGKVKCNLSQPLLYLGNQYGVAGNGRLAPRRRWDDSFSLNNNDDDDCEFDESVCIGAGARNEITLLFDFVELQIVEQITLLLLLLAVMLLL